MRCRQTRIVVTAKGKAIDKKDLPLGEKMEPLDFQMQPGGTIRIRVVDSEGKPCRARESFSRNGRENRFSTGNSTRLTNTRIRMAWGMARSSA